MLQWKIKRKDNNNLLRRLLMLCLSLSFNLFPNIKSASMAFFKTERIKFQIIHRHIKQAFTFVSSMADSPEI